FHWRSPLAYVSGCTKGEGRTPVEHIFEIGASPAMHGLRFLKTETDRWVGKQDSVPASNSSNLQKIFLMSETEYHKRYPADNNGLAQGLQLFAKGRKNYQS